MSDVENECNDWTFIIAGYEYGKKTMLEYALSEGEKFGRSLFKRLIK